jgi:hypothetical protein
MTSRDLRKFHSRRRFLQGAGGAFAFAAGTGLVPGFLRRVLPGGLAAAAPGDPPHLFLAGTDGWIHLPGPSISFYHPDSLSPDADLAGLNAYIFGFRNITGLASALATFTRAEYLRTPFSTRASG